MDVGIPLQGTAESVQDTDKTRCKIFRFVHLVEQAQDNGPYGIEKAVQQRAVRKEKPAELPGDCEDTMTMFAFDQLSRHGCRAFSGIKVSAGRTKPGMAAKRDKLKMAAKRAAIHGAAKGGVTTVDHSVDVFGLCAAGMESIYDFFIMVTKNILKYVHGIHYEGGGRKKERTCSSIQV